MQPTRFRPTPTTLKWLVEKRARTAHDLNVTNDLVRELTERLTKLTDELTSLDKVIQIYDPAITPESIEPINGWQGNYGKRGALRAYIKEVMQTESPHWVATDLIRTKVMAHFGIQFETPRQAGDWYRGSFRSTLKKLCSDGLIEREHDPDVKTGLAGRWRWADPTMVPTLGSLER